MSFFTANGEDDGVKVKDFFTIPLKPRHDSVWDRYHRIFMVKLLLLSAIIVGIVWYEDDVNCVIPDTLAKSEDVKKFMTSACWIQGLYVYTELKSRTDKVAYFGIPQDIASDGLFASKHLCRTSDKFRYPNYLCKPMTKTFFLQYQWLPFYIASLCILFYVPYVLFRKFNHEMVNLKNDIMKDTPAKKLCLGYFQVEEKTWLSTAFYIFSNFMLKLLYLVASVMAFVLTNSILHDGFTDYGIKWVKWSKLNNTMQFDYMGLRDFPKPGNELFPPFGYCELYEGSKDLKTTTVNKHKIVCELSQHVLYQYVFLVLWFAFVVGMILAIIGLIQLFVHYCLIWRKQRKRGNKISFTREEYLDLIKSTDRKKYIGVLQEYSKIKPDIGTEAYL